MRTERENPMWTQDDLQTFLRSHKAASQLAWKASDDYVLARCGMINGLWSAFEMATQATEKFLKSYLLLRDKTLLGSTDKMRKAVRLKAKGSKDESEHNIRACLDLAMTAGLPCSAKLAYNITRINSYYSQRYPDSDTLQYLDSGEVHDLDEVVFQIWDAFKDINDDYYHVTGLMGPVYSFYLHRGTPQGELGRGTYDIMTFRNKAFEDRRADIERGILQRLSR